LAPGFAAETLDLSPTAETTTIKLRLATAAETVVVTATRTPVPGEAAGAGKPKGDDPFADLESLEAEMARLLGRGG